MDFGLYFSHHTALSPGEEGWVMGKWIFESIAQPENLSTCSENHSLRPRKNLNTAQPIKIDILIFGLPRRDFAGKLQEKQVGVLGFEPRTSALS
ncbi:MAG: hypothetical protein ACK47R_03940, partial [Planctomycetia bacterium]